jgi:hypothetical protein
MLTTKFKEKITTKKGDYGELIGDKRLKEKGIIAYMPVFDGAHPFDRLCATLDKKILFVNEYKTKPYRLYYPDTGFNLSQYKGYVYTRDKYNMDIFICFVDEIKKEAYGNWLRKLENEIIVSNDEINKHRMKNIGKQYNKGDIKYPLIEKSNKRDNRAIIYFPLKNTKFLFKITEEEILKLKELSSRNYNYEE